MSIKNKIKNEEAILIVGSLLLIIALALFHYEKILEINNEIYNNIQSKIYQENNKNNFHNFGRLNSQFTNTNP